MILISQRRLVKNHEFHCAKNVRVLPFRFVLMWNKTWYHHCWFGAWGWQNYRHMSKGSAAAAEGSECQSWFVARRQNSQRDPFSMESCLARPDQVGLENPTCLPSHYVRMHFYELGKMMSLSSSSSWRWSSSWWKCSIANVPRLDNVCQRFIELNCTWLCMYTHIWDPQPKFTDLFSKEISTAYWITVF